MLGSEESEPVVYWENIMEYINSVNSIIDEFRIKFLSRQQEIDQREAEKHNINPIPLLYKQLRQIFQKFNEEYSPQTLLLKMNSKIEELENTINVKNSQCTHQLEEFKAARITSIRIPIIQPEEVKKSETYDANKIQTDQHGYFDEAYSSLRDIDSFKQSDFQYKQNTEYRILHQYKSVEPELIVVRLEMGILQSKVPNGPSLIQYKDPPNLSFRGICRFNEGQMIDRILAEQIFKTSLYFDKDNKNIDSLKTKIHLSGRQYYPFQVDSQRILNQKGKVWNNGCIYIGGLEHQIKIEVKKQELQADSNHGGKEIEELITQDQEIYRSLERMETEHICQLQPQLDNLQEKNSQANKSFYELEKTIQETTGTLNRGEQEPKGQTITYCSDSFSRQSQQHVRNIDYTNKIIELTYDEENEIQEYLFLNQNIEQIIKLKCNSSSEAYYIHSRVLKYALDNNHLHFFKDIFQQNVVQNEDLTIIEKLQLLSSNQDISKKDMKFLCKTKQSILYRVGETTAKQALIKDEYSLNQKIKMVLNNVFQAQMQALIGKRQQLEVRQCFQIDEKMNLNDFIWSIPTLEVLKDQNLQSEEEVLRIMTMILISIHHLHSKNLFHGDIKPANIFFDKDFKIMTTDVGSLIYLGKPDEDELETSKFIVTCYTENYASAEYIDAVKNKIPLTREQLMKEDKHQLKCTLQAFLNNQKNFSQSEQCNQILRYFDDEAFTSVSQIYEKIAQSEIEFLSNKYKYVPEKQVNEEILEDIDYKSQPKLIKLYLEQTPIFNLPIKQDQYDYLESFGIMESALSRKQWYDKIINAIKQEDQEDESIESLIKLIKSFNRQSILIKEKKYFQDTIFLENEDQQLKIEFAQNNKIFQLKFFQDQEPLVLHNHRKRNL